MTRALCLLALLAWAGVHGAQANVTLSGLLGEKALISVNGGPPKVPAVGEAHKGVKLLAVRGQQVEIEEAGQRRVLGMGFSGGGVSQPGSKVSLTADGRGQFVAQGEVNGTATRFLVDTGASLVALPRSMAERAGVRLGGMPSIVLNTANGRTKAFNVLLNSVTVGDIRASLVEAIVLEDRQLSVPLLGMSFLNRVNMNRDGDMLTLSQRY